VPPREYTGGRSPHCAPEFAPAYYELTWDGTVIAADKLPPQKSRRALARAQRATRGVRGGNYGRRR
jgi:hypothetical protein